MVTKAQGKLLIKIARAAIERAFRHKSFPAPAHLRKQHAFSQKPGVFVTLLKKSEFRGSVGYPQGTYSLIDGVVRAARDAAFNDPRFKALKKSELQRLRVRVDVLSRFKKTSIKGIRAGKDGTYVEFGLFKALQLPEDAKKFKWTAREMVENALRKAGLAAEMWKDRNVKIYRFSTTAFEEKAD